MFEDTEDPQLSESPGASSTPPDSGVPQEPSQPESPTPEPKSTLPEEIKRPKRTTDYLKEIRRKLADEESDRSKSASGGLFWRITGPLRKLTGPLSAPPPPPDEIKKTTGESPQAEIGNDFLSGRLSSATAAEPTSLLPEPPAFSSSPTDEPLEIGTFQDQPGPAGDEPAPGDNEPITFLDNGAMVLPESVEATTVEATTAQAAEPDWMREIRDEAARDTTQTGEKNAGSKTDPYPLSSESTASTRTTGQLRDFISSILRRPEEKPQKAPDIELTDDVVTGRLGLNLGTEPAPQTPLAEPPANEINLDEQFSTFFRTTHSLDNNEIAEPPAVEDRDSFLEGLGMNFGQLGEGEIGEEIGSFDLYPEDEALLWGESGQPASDQTLPETPAAPEDLWKAEPDPYAYGSDLRRQIWGTEEESAPAEPDTLETPQAELPVADDAYAAAFLAGIDYAAEDNLDPLFQNQVETEQPEGSVSVNDLRSIALEDYEEGAQDTYEDWKPRIDWGDEEGKTPTLVTSGTKAAHPEHKPTREQARAEEKIEPAPDWKTWMATRFPVQKILVAEAVIVAVALLLAVPFFILMIIHGSAKPAQQIAVNTLPAYLPHPTGLTLPGGWYFTLGKSTITNGQWRPVTSEWLEGTELRRVIALPWNMQTEAVVKTFKPGDPVDLYLNNHNILKYKISSIERVPVGDNQIYSARTSSLAIILFNEKEPSRWVVICTP